MVILPDGLPIGGRGIGYSYLTYGVAQYAIFLWSRSADLGFCISLWLTFSEGGPIIYHFSGAFGSNGVAVNVFIFLLWSRSFYGNTHDGCYIFFDGTPAGKYGGWVIYSYGVAMHVHFWSRRCLDGHSGGMWGTIQDGMFQTSGFGTMTLHGVA